MRGTAHLLISEQFNKGGRGNKSADVNHIGAWNFAAAFTFRWTQLSAIAFAAPGLYPDAAH